MHRIAHAMLAVCLVWLTGAASPPTVAPSPAEIVAAAPGSAWRPIDADTLMVMDLAGNRRVVIELAPDFAPIHIANIRALIRMHRFDGGAVVRMQDGYVVQWAATDSAKPQPTGFATHPAPEYDRPMAGLPFRRLASADAYAPIVGFSNGWQVASDGKRAWLTHCYASVGVGRDMPPDTGSGSELYAVIGQAPRQLDRNIALIGRVVAGMDALTSLPRGTGDMGFYTDVGQRRPILTVALAADMPDNVRPHFEIMREDAPSFAAYLEARASRRDPFYVRPAGGVDICNAPVPIRAAR